MKRKSAFSSFAVALAATFLVVAGVAACGRDPVADADLSADLQLVTRDAALPELSDTLPAAAAPVVQQAPARAATDTRPRQGARPASPAPRRVTASAPAPVQPPVEQAEARAQVPTAAPQPTIASGARVALTTAAPICTSNRPGDRFVATVMEPVIGSNGALIPAGSKAVVQVAEVTRGAPGDGAHLALRVSFISVDGNSYPTAGRVELGDTLVAKRTPGGSDKKKVVGGAIAGAVLGQVLGKDTRSTVIGAAAGAAAGTAAAMSGDQWDGCLPENSRIVLVLTDEMSLVASGS